MSAYLILTHDGKKMVVDANSIKAIYSEYIMYDRDRTHLLIGSKTLTCDESVEEVWSFIQSLMLDAAKDGKPTE